MKHTQYHSGVLSAPHSGSVNLCWLRGEALASKDPEWHS